MRPLIPDTAAHPWRFVEWTSGKVVAVILILWNLSGGQERAHRVLDAS